MSRHTLLAQAEPPSSAPLAAPRLQVVHSRDIDEHAARQAHWSLRYEQLSSGPFEGDFTQVALPGLQVVSERASVALRQHGDLGHQRYGFALPCQQRGEAFFNGQSLGPHTMMIGRGDALDLASPADFQLIGIVVEADLLSGLWQQLYHRPLAHWLEHQIVVHLPAARASALCQLHLDMLARLQASAAFLADPQAVLQLRDELLIEWIEAIPDRVDISGLKTTEARKRLVDKACALMLAQPDRPMSNLEVCRQVGASPRNLGYCFKEVLGISPAKYAKALRLNGVRRELKRHAGGQSGVHDLAARWGFWNLGEFAGIYRRQFGELPSTTLRGDRCEVR
jgi:AraC family transcriptional regulator, ethanolamine operon transcriptional activator